MTLDFDPTDLDFIRDPYPTLNALRESTPVFHSERFGKWFVTRYQHVHDLLRDKRLGRVHDHVVSRQELGLPARDPDYLAFWDNERYSLLELEPPDHTRIRSLVAREFTPRRVEGMRDQIGQIANRLLDELIPRGEFDLIHDFAEPFSVHIISELLGAPTEDWRSQLAWSHAIVKMYELNTSREQALAASQGAAEHAAYIRALIAQRREQPTDDLISGLAHVEAQEGKLTDDEIVSTCIVLLNAGHEATVNALGNGVHALMKNRDQWERLHTGEVAAKEAVEEFFRYDGPLQMFERWVLAEDFEAAGAEIPFGGKVAFLFGAANHDPRHFAEPEVFDIGRNDATHVSFGGGVHFCIGAPLARLESAVALEQLMNRGPDLRLAVQDPPRNPTFVQRAFSELPVSA